MREQCKGIISEAIQAPEARSLSLRGTKQSRAYKGLLLVFVGNAQ